MSSSQHGGEAGPENLDASAPGGSRRVGEIIRRTREGKGYSINEMSRFTHIQGIYLTALEEGNVAALPGPAFVVGFLRLYLRSLGLPEQELVEQYVAQLEDQRNALYFAAPSTPRNRPSWQLATGGLALLALSLVGYEVQMMPESEREGLLNRLAFWQGFATSGQEGVVVLPAGGGDASGGRNAALNSALPGHPGAASGATVDVEPPGEPDEEPEPQGAQTPAVASTPASAAPAAPTASAPQTATSRPLPAATPIPVVTSAPAASSAPVVTPAPAATSQQAAAAAPVAPATSGSVVLVADGEVWVQIKDKSGRVVKEMVMRPGQRYEVANGGELAMTVGNAGGLRFLVGDKEVVPLGPVGTVVRNVTPTAEHILGRTRP